MSDGCPPEVLLDMQSLTELLPSYNQASVWRLNTARGGKGRLPAYDRVFGATRLWELETILDWAERTGRADKIDQQVLARIVGGCD
jgi:hypothetical protein